MDHDISFDFLLRILKKTWWKIVIITLAVMLLVGAFTHFFIPKKYSSSVSFYIVNTNSSVDYISSSLLSSATQLVNDYTDIITSEHTLSLVAEKLSEKYSGVTIKELQSMISCKSKTSSSVFTLTVEHTDPQVAYDVAETIRQVAPAAVTDLVKPDSLTHESLADKVHKVIDYYNTYKISPENPRIKLTEKEISDMLRDGFVGIPTRQDCIAPMDTPKLATSHHYPNVFLFALIGGVAAALASYLLFLLYHILEMNLTNEDDIKKLVKRPLIGTVPHWELTQKK